MTPLQMLESLKDHLDAPDEFWSNEQLWRRLSDAQQEVIRDITGEDPSFFVQTYDISFVSGQATYSLPQNAQLGTRIIFAENRVGQQGSEVPPADLREMLSFTQPGVVNLSEYYHFALEGGKVRVLPTPGSSGASAIRIYFIPSYGHMMQGTASAGGTNTLTFFASDPNWTTNFGWRDVRNDFYNGMQVLIYEGTSAGDVRMITDYVGGSTYQITVDEDWTSTPDTTSKFAIMCPVPEQHHQTVVLNAALKASIKGRTRDRELHRAYYGHAGAPGALKDLLSWVGKRQDARIETVKPVDVGA
jgi:hypothetical protein